MKRLVIIDGKSVLYRGYYAMGNLRTADGTPTGGIYGFTSILLEILRKLDPDYVAVAWDKRGTNIRRRLEIYPEYKAGRAKAPDDFYAQIPLLLELLNSFHIPLYEADDYEADDIMGTLSAKANAVGVETILISGDLDMLQIVDHDTKFYALKHGFSQVDEFDLKAFRNKYGIDKSQFLDLKSLKGDSSDNIPGVPGVGEKTAIKLVQDYGSLDDIYENIDKITGALHDKLVAGKDSAYMSRQLSLIMDDAPVDFDPEATDIHAANPTEVLSILQHLEFRSLYTKADKIFGSGMETPTRSSNLAEPARISSSGPATASRDASAYSGSRKDNLEQGSRVAIPEPEIIEFDVKSKLHKNPELLKDKTFWDLNQAAFILGAPKPTENEDKRALFRSQADAFSRTPKLYQLYRDFDLALIPVLYQMEIAGIAIDPDYFQKLHNHLSEQLEKLSKQIFEHAGGEFNLNSPAQLSEILFDKLGLATKGIRKRQKFLSTDASTLEKLRDSHPIIPLIENYREISKLLSTYVDALPQLKDDQNRIHTTYTQDITATGRLSSKDPNLQNIPVRTEMGREIRTGFVARPGHVFVSADYSQFELRLAAVLAGDKGLVDDFNAGIDIHTKTASDVFGIPMDEVTKDQRRAAKVINFGILYGMSAHGLSQAADMSVPEAASFIDKYFTLRAPIREYLDKTLNQARTEGYVETYYGRRRYTPDVHSPVYVVRQGAERAAMNMPIQGTEADLMKRAMIQLADQNMILQVHDSLMIECPEADADKIAKRMREIMESVAPELKIKLAVDISTGKDWGEL